MTTLQFVERRSGNTASVIDVFEGSGQQSVRDAFSRGLEPLLWGSWDLVEIVGRLVTLGARATEATLSNRALERVRGEDVDATAEEIVEAINGKKLDAVASDLHDHKYLVAAITVFLPNVGLIRLVQNGQADLLNDADSEAVLERIRPALIALPR